MAGRDLSNLPDIDFLPGMLQGRPNLFHHGIFHSLGAALFVAALGAAIFYPSRKRFWAYAAWIFLVFYSHLLLDFFSQDARPPYGLPLFWPFSSRYFIAARPFFINIVRSNSTEDFFISLFNRHNLGAALRETMVLGGLALAAALMRRRFRRGPAEK
jgi:inner membrane protein